MPGTQSFFTQHRTFERKIDLQTGEVDMAQYHAQDPKISQDIPRYPKGFMCLVESCRLESD